MNQLLQKQVQAHPEWFLAIKTKYKSLIKMKLGFLEHYHNIESPYGSTNENSYMNTRHNEIPPKTWL